MQISKWTLIIFAQLLSLSLLAATPNVQNSANNSGSSQKPNNASILGFKEWKENRVVKAKDTLDQFKAPKQDSLSKNEPADPKNVEKSGEMTELPAEKVEDNAEKAPPETAEKTEKDSKKPEASEVANKMVNEDKKPEAPKEKSPESIAQEEKLRQLEFNLEIAQGLTIHDYFALYLKDKSKEDMAAAILKLSPQEVSELLMAYKSSLYGSPKVQKQAKKLN